MLSAAEHVTQAGADQNCCLKEGSPIFANCGVSLGFARILKFGGCIHNGWLAIDDLDNRLNKVFLLKWLNQLTNYFRSIAPDDTQPNLNTGIVNDQEIYLPPRELQENYENILYRHDEILGRLKKSDNVLGEGFSSVSRQAFKGKI